MYETRWYQDEAEFALFDYFYRGMKGNPICAMPTGTGKSLVIANFIRKVFGLWPNQRVMMLTHVKKLIEQNASKLIDVWPHAPLGIYSAGLNSRDMIMPIVYAGVQSVAPAIKRAVAEVSNTPWHMRHFGFRDLVLIDECHLLGPKETSQYQFIISELKKINPDLKVIGFSATPYRTKQGMLTDGGLFTDICYDITGIESFNRLIAEGFMAPLVAKPTRTVVDISNVGISAGEYNQQELQNAVDTDEITYNAVKEVIESSYGRNAWIVFAAGIENAEHINAMLQSFGVCSTVVHSKLGEKECDKRIEAYKRGEYQAIVNKDMLTTGFDHPIIDLIADLQPTMAPGKHVQKYGRGTRPATWAGKTNCLCLDFAKNVPRLGPINDPKIPGKPGKGTGDAPVRICPICGMYNHATSRFCGGGSGPEEAKAHGGCGVAFIFETKLFASAGEVPLLRDDSPVVEYMTVNKVIYNLHEKKDSAGFVTSPPSIKVSYFCGNFNMYNEWVCLEHGGLAGRKAKDWWRQRHAEEPPATTYEALRRVNELRMPVRIRVHVNKKYPEVLSYEY